MAHPLRKAEPEAFDRVEPVKHPIDFSVQTVPALVSAGLSAGNEIQQAKGGYTNPLAAAGAASVVVGSLVAGTPLAGLGVLIGAIAARKALMGFGNWILDNTL